MNVTVDDLPREVVDALEQGNVIGAIKQLRSAQGIGLKESKDAVDRYLAGHPELRQRLDAARSASSRSAGRWFVVLMVIGLAIYLLLRAFRT